MKLGKCYRLFTETKQEKFSSIAGKSLSKGTLGPKAQLLAASDGFQKHLETPQRTSIRLAVGNWRCTDL